MKQHGPNFEQLNCPPRRIAHPFSGQSGRIWQTSTPIADDHEFAPIKPAFNSSLQTKTVFKGESLVTVLI
jgi:hypothetical protein